MALVIGRRDGDVVILERGQDRFELSVGKVEGVYACISVGGHTERLRDGQSLDLPANMGTVLIRADNNPGQIRLVFSCPQSVLINRLERIDKGVDTTPKGMRHSA